MGAAHLCCKAGRDEHDPFVFNHVQGSAAAPCIPEKLGGV